jgi:mRNA-degrading endonuclease RelE of RelBE toxin-antitoxin system
MNYEVKKSFSRDIAKIRDKALLNAIAVVIENIEQAQSIQQIKHIQKIQGSKNHYRIRIGDYRMGLFSNGITIYIVRFLHRKEIYKYFP